MPVLTKAHITRADMQENPGTLYLFGDNVQREGDIGQSKEMRGEPNACGKWFWVYILSWLYLLRVTLMSISKLSNTYIIIIIVFVLPICTSISISVYF